jgi:hypothetical protein
MPYGSLGAKTLSQASRIGLEKAVDWWQKSMQTQAQDLLRAGGIR